MFRPKNRILSHVDFRRDFSIEPDKYFRSFAGDRYSWRPELPTGFGEVSFGDIYVKNDTDQVGYIQRIHMISKSSDVIVKHIATSTNYSRMGIAPIMARHFAWRFARLYGTKNILFDVSHSQYDDWSYDEFFYNLGAVEVPDQIRVWRWNVSGYRN